MKYLKLAGAALALSFTSQISAQDFQFTAIDKSLETQFCVSIGNNNVESMKGQLFRMGLGDALRRNINTLTCNGLPLAQFAFKYQAEDTFRYLNTRSSPANRVKSTVTINDLAMTNNNAETTVVRVSAG
ncbi:DUF3718 domain-containing protein [Alteromonas gilva]|uniref:DUF3718 domain-containing protein n=1 Tax=Alteromonas gilva TaxID=2987522 RepID=A0ABT5KYB6_9ALTE|nr:DUF3718 domain-containing protein [Alteromonas gilva]MDC8829637.1 DUF3718 domain-containing protein [Alteromonas gilva]